MGSPKARGALLVMAGLIMMFISITEDLRILEDTEGPQRVIPSISLVISVWIIISARLKGYKLARWLHDLRVLREHGLSRRHVMIGKPLGLIAGLLVSGVVLLTGAFLAVRLMSLVLIGLFLSSLIGSFAIILFSLVSGPSMMVGWYLLDRTHVDRSYPGETVTWGGRHLMRTLDRAEEGERKARNAVVSSLDATQSGIRYARKVIRKRRR